MYFKLTTINKKTEIFLEEKFKGHWNFMKNEIISKFILYN